jgi:hypothetical protein
LYTINLVIKQDSKIILYGEKQIGERKIDAIYFQGEKNLGGIEW